jgi:hypothetical protein
MGDNDDELVIPMGAGLSYRHRGLMADARLTFRLASKEDLVIMNPGSPLAEEYAAMHTWGVTTQIGYEF